MASIIRPTVLKRTCLGVISKRAFTATASSSAPACSWASKSALSRPIARNSFAKNHLPSPARIAPFHASGAKAIFPVGPQVLQSGVNDPAPVPETSPTHGSYHWDFERLVCIGIVPLTIAPFAAGSLNPVLDAILCGTMLIHSHIGFDSCVTDYFPKWRMPKIRMFMTWVLRLCTVAVGVGFYEFETNDVGLTEAIKRIWTA